MPETESVEKSVKLMTLWVKEIGPKELDPQEQWWTFPSQGPVMGFFGVRPLMRIGDQPSTNPWPETHPSRVLLYGTLIKLEVPDAHRRPEVFLGRSIFHRWPSPDSTLLRYAGVVSQTIGFGIDQAPLQKRGLRRPVFAVAQCAA